MKESPLRSLKWYRISSSEWIREAAPKVKAVRLDDPDIILNELPILSQDADFVVADGPPGHTETSPALG